MPAACSDVSLARRRVASGGVLLAIDKVWNGYIQTITDRSGTSMLGAVDDRLFSQGIAFDNGLPFIGFKVTKFLVDLNIKRITSSPYYPSANSQAESTNKTIIQNLKMKLEDAKCVWPSKLLEVLWAYRTTAKYSTKKTPFSLVYGVEVLIPVKFGIPSSRYIRAKEQSNSDAMLVKLDLLEEHIDLTYIQMMALKQRMERYYNRHTNLLHFKLGELVHHKVTHNTKDASAGKLGSNWECPYKVTGVAGKGSYQLKEEDGNKLPRNWILS
ncbi:uncharacterized protein LOC132619548 [Lycium barbarum]|uniref:uncharacterized protein LOC132619548 n=1 Tax=Lycium barbarum TaxID=112863 RepID=UPI00293EC22D|nr:uncharacterized protein LOC132619548 [Lycium barbarum]